MGISAALTPRFSIVIPLYNRVLFTTICARALVAVADRWDETEVLFVDNGSSDGTAAFLRTLPPPFRVVTHATNEGFARACNAGAAAARGDYLVFLNNDTVPQPGWLSALADARDLPESPAVVGARLLFPDETVQHAGIGFNARDEPAHRHYGAAAGGDDAVSGIVPAVTGACLLIGREQFAALGGFDEGYRNGFEDLDLCCRVRAAGDVVWYAAGSVLYHFESASAGRYAADRANYERFRARWGEWLAADALAHPAAPEATETEAAMPVRLARTYTSSADMRRELDRVLADAESFRSGFARLDAAYRALVADFARQKAWAESLAADATRVRRRNRAQRIIGRVFGL